MFSIKIAQVIRAYLSVAFLYVLSIYLEYTATIIYMTSFFFQI